MKNVLTLLGAVMIFTGFAVAQPAELEVGPGWITPDSAMYGFETAWDNSMAAIGLKNRGSIAQERASEAKAMAEENNSEGMQRAVDELNKVASVASSSDTKGLEKASAVISAVMERAPKQAQKGLQNALDNINKAHERNGGIPDQAKKGQDNKGDAGDAGDKSMTAQEKVDKAEKLREKGRKAIKEGNNLLDQGAYDQAKAKFGEAEKHFEDSKAAVEGVENAAASDIKSKIENSISGAMNLQDSVQSYMDGNNQTAETEAQQAQQDFEKARGDTR